MRLVFMGTPDFARTALDALHAAGHQIVAVYAQPPRPAGRGKKPRPTPVHVRAEALGLPVHTPTSLRDSAALAGFAAHRADAAVVAAYGLILPSPLLALPRLGCLNIHASLLPRWRGAAPVQRAIMAGDAETGVCVMRMEAGLDTGPVLARVATSIDAADTGATLTARLAQIGAEAMVDTLARLRDDPGLQATPQPETGVTYAKKIDKAEARIDWTQPAEQIDRQIRALSPIPGAWSLIADARVRLLMSRLADPPGGADPAGGAGTAGGAETAVRPGGTVLAAGPAGLIVACGEGAVALVSLQRAGAGPLDTAAFLRGRPLAVGTRLG
ncbi:MAG: methionyl-tRNA formyltransferase [Pseudomonadota bacterium]